LTGYIDGFDMNVFNNVERHVMPRRPAAVTQADVARSVRAAMQAGAPAVEIRPDGTIVVVLKERPRPAKPVSKTDTATQPDNIVL
jgi:hypothetical protein